MLVLLTLPMNLLSLRSSKTVFRHYSLMGCPKLSDESSRSLFGVLCFGISSIAVLSSSSGSAIVIAHSVLMGGPCDSLRATARFLCPVVFYCAILQPVMLYYVHLVNRCVGCAVSTTRSLLRGTHYPPCCTAQSLRPAL